MYENMTPRQRYQAYAALMYPVLVRKAAEGKLPGLLKPADKQMADGGGRAAEDTGHTSRQSA